MTVDATDAIVSGRRFGGQSMIASLRRVLVQSPGTEYNAENWRAWGLPGEPDVEQAVRQHAQLVDILEGAGVEVEYLRDSSSLTADATYDPALITNEGAVMLRSGRPERRAEVMPMARRLIELGVPIIGSLRDEGYVDGGDALWVDRETLVVGRTYRSNDEGFRQLKRTLDGIVPTVLQVELPHWEGPDSVLHLMSVVNLVAEDAAVFYPRATPIRMVELLKEREFRLVEVAEKEGRTSGANALALSSGRVILAAGNPITRGRLEDAGIEVQEYEADELDFRRGAGPTCHALPLLRSN